MPQMGYICTPNVWIVYPEVWHIYCINVPQSVGREKKYPIVALVWEKAEFRGHPSSLNRERDGRETRLKERETD